MYQRGILVFAVAAAASPLVFSLDFDPTADDLLARTVAQTLNENGTGALTRVTKKPVRMAIPVAQLCRAPFYNQPHDPHEQKFIHVFVNKVGLKTIQTGEGVYPVGSFIVKQKFTNEKGTETELFTVMQKMKKGYDKENGDWEYSVVNADATLVLSRGKIDSCIACHDNYSSTDYVTRTYLNR